MTEYYSHYHNAVTEYETKLRELKRLLQESGFSDAFIAITIAGSTPENVDSIIEVLSR